MLVTEDLIARLERSDAAWLAQSVTAAAGDVLHLRSGVAAFCGPGDVLTQAVAVGLDGPLEESDWLQITAHYSGRCERFEFKLSPIADAEVVRKIALHAVDVSEFESLLVQPLSNSVGRMDSRIEEIPREKRPDYVRESAPWFYSGGDMPPGLVETISAASQIPIGRSFCIRDEGQIVAGASLTIQDGIAWLHGGVVHPEHRRKGYHRALIAHRLAVAYRLGAEVAAQGAAPGSQSQLNAQANGFSVAYTRPSFFIVPELA